MINSLSQQITTMNEDNLQMATSSQLNFSSSIFISTCPSLDGIPLSTSSISSLRSFRHSPSSTPLNLSALNHFEKEFNRQTSLRESLLGFLLNLRLQGLRSILIQSTSSRKTSIIISKKQKDSRSSRLDSRLGSMFPSGFNVEFFRSNSKSLLAISSLSSSVETSE